MSNNTALIKVPKAVPAAHVSRAVAQLRCEYGIHDRAFTKSDFLRICRRERILLNIKRLVAKYRSIAEFEQTLGSYQGILGYYVRLRDDLHFRTYPMIYLRCLATAECFDLETAFHELGHHFLGHSRPFHEGSDRYSDDAKAMDAEADLFAQLAMCGGGDDAIH